MQLPKPVHKPAFNVTRASHLVLRVKDLEASRAFYCDRWWNDTAALVQL